MFNRILAFTYVASSICILGISSLTLEITNTTVEYINKDYIDTNSSVDQLIEANGTTKFFKFMDILQDFPENVTLTVDVISYASEEDSGQYIGTYISNICDPNDPYRQYLMDFLIELTSGGNCMIMGEYEFEDAGQFKFYELLPEVVHVGNSFKTILVYRTAEVLIKMYSIESKSV